MGQADAPGRAGRPRSSGGFVAHTIRRAGCGLMFVVFGVGAVVLAPTAMVVAAFRPARQRATTVQGFVHHAFRAFMRFGGVLGLLAMEIEEGERLERGPAVVVANHPSLLDVVVLIAYLPQADCIVKREAWANPFLRLIVSAAGYLPNERGDRLVANAAERLRSGRTLVLFPEGSRSPAEGLRRFERGAAQIALASGRPIRPVRIRCEPRILRKGQPFWDIPNRTVCYSLSVGEDVDVEASSDGAPRPIVARRVTRELERMYEDWTG